MKHSIRKQVIDLTIDSSQDSFRIQQKASEYFYQRIAPALEKVLDELSDETHLLGINSLELNLGTLEWQDDYFMTDETVLYQRLKEQVQQSLEKIMAGSKNNVTQAAQETSIEENACRQWLTYMEKGYLHWSIDHTSDEWRQQVLETLAMNYAFVQQLKDLIITNRDALTRIVNDHPVSFLRQLSEVLTARSQRALPGKMEQHIKKNQSLSTEGSEISSGKIMSLAWQKLLYGFAKGEKEEDILPELSITESWNDLPGPQIEWSAALPDDGLFTANAGLLLLHPFYWQAFERIGLLLEKKFTNRPSQEKAVLLLHYVATGNTVAAEYQLLVPKIICGIAVRESLREQPVILDNEKIEMRYMMESAIEQWSILKNTSIDGLREGFLQRGGKFYPRNGEFSFTMEKSAIDILLDHLPWNISIIKFPWLPQLIRVDWR